MGKEGTTTTKKEKPTNQSHFGFSLYWGQSLTENKVTENTGSGSSAPGLSQA